MTPNRDDPNARRQSQQNPEQTPPGQAGQPSQRGTQPPQHGGQQPPGGGQPPQQGSGGRPPQQGGGTGGQRGRRSQQGRGQPPRHTHAPQHGGQPPSGQPSQGGQPLQHGGQQPSGGGQPAGGGQPPQQWHQPPQMGQSGQQQGRMEQGGTGPQPGGMAPAQGSQSMGPAGGPQLQPVTVEDIVQTDVVTVQRDTPVATVVAQMAEKDVGSVVVTDDDTPVGIVTDRGVALALESTPDITDRTADEVMVENVVTGTVEMSVFDALQRLEEEEIRRLPIVEEDGSLEGIVTLDDILYLLGTELEHATSIIEAQSPRI